jgi:hypothetical protein
MKVSLGSHGCSFRPWKRTDGRIFGSFSFDTETTLIDKERPDLTPVFVLGAASDGQQGVFITRDCLVHFFQAHAQSTMICHNASFDLRVIAEVLRPAMDIYQLVERNQVWCTMILARLHALATEGHTARGTCSLAHCARAYLGVELAKDSKDAEGDEVRTSFGKYLGQHPAKIPQEHLRYLGLDTLATWMLFAALQRRIKEVLARSHGVWGYVDERWLRDVVNRYGLLTHHVQLRASILMDALTASGIAVDQGRSGEKERKLRAVLEETKKRLRERGYLAGEKGSSKALQSLLSEFKRKSPDLPLATTPTGKWSTAGEDLAELALEDPFFADLALYRACDKLLTTYLRKLHRPRVHAKFGYLLETGRTCCGGGLNLQNLPKEKNEQDAAATVRGSFVPDEGDVFIDADYSQIELVVFAHALERQFRLGSTLAGLINSGQDLHRRIAGAVLGKPPEEVTKSERGSAKPVSFGRPGGMGPERLQRIARASYNLELSLEEVEQRIQAYHRLCPELDAFLTDEHDAGKVIAEVLDLTPAEYGAATGRWLSPHDPASHWPVGWLGGMLLKVLREETPATRAGRAYTAEEIDYFWQRACSLPIELKPPLAAALVARKPGAGLHAAVRNWAGRRPVFTLTGRLRAGASFCSGRNCIFQGPAADGAILGMWRVWRAGYKLANFIHDQVVVPVKADDQVQEHAARIDALMIQGMGEVLPGMLVKVETCITRSLNKDDFHAPAHPGPASSQALPGGGASPTA